MVVGDHGRLAHQLAQLLGATDNPPKPSPTTKPVQGNGAKPGTVSVGAETPKERSYFLTWVGLILAPLLVMAVGGWIAYKAYPPTQTVVVKPDNDSEEKTPSLPSPK